MKTIKTDTYTGLYNLRHQTKNYRWFTEYIDVKKLAKSYDIICVRFENSQISYRVILSDTSNKTYRWFNEYIDVKKLVKSTDIICIEFENPQISYRLIYSDTSNKTYRWFTEYIDVKKLVKSDDIISIQFENPQISSTGLPNLIDQTNLTDDLLNTSMLKNL